MPEAAFVPNTAISSAAVNDDFSDIATTLTDSLSRTGLGGMTSALSLSLSGFFYQSDPDTGMSRSAANTQVVTVGGVNWTFTTSDLTSPDGSSLAPLIGEVRIWALPNPPTGWILLYGQACTTTYPLWRAALIAAGNPYGSSGGDPLFPDLRCYVPMGSAFMGGSLSTVVTSTYFGANPAQLGAPGGSQNHALVTGELPSITPSGGVSVSDSRTWATAATVVTTGPGTPVGTPSAGATLNVASIAVNASGSSPTGSFSGTPFGNNQPHTNMQPSIVLNFIGRAA